MREGCCNLVPNSSPQSRVWWLHHGRMVSWCFHYTFIIYKQPELTKTSASFKHVYDAGAKSHTIKSMFFCHWDSRVWQQQFDPLEYEDFQLACYFQKARPVTWRSFEVFWVYHFRSKSKSRESGGKKLGAERYYKPSFTMKVKLFIL